MDSKAVLDIFKKITTIPRESGHEEAMVQWLKDWASEHSLDCKCDKVGNILITKEAHESKKHVPAIVIQAHQDMVCEKIAGSSHNFATDPIRYDIEDGWMIAKETTLGADDGIGIASALALLEDPAPKGKVECLFTISEETDMNGAEHLEEGFFSGKTLINVDSEDEGEIFIGCSGGLNTVIDFELKLTEIKKGWKTIRLSVEGGLGGHSGDDINKDRMNTLQQLCRFLYNENKSEMQLCQIDGGNKSNAIARDASAIIAVPDAEASIERFKTFGATVNTEFHNTDPDVKFTATEAIAEKAVEAGQATSILAALYACPHGVQAMSQDVPGMVQTSTNFASVKMLSEDRLCVVTSQRSPAPSERHMIADKIVALFTLAGGKAEKILEYPGWEPNPNSAVLKRCVDTYVRLFGKKPVVRAIHAGLECGMFLTKFPDLDMISFGPTLRGVHAPGEKLDLASLDRYNALLEDMVNNFE